MGNNVITRARVIYNDNSIDSLLGALLMVSSIREVWMLNSELDTKLELVPYDCVRHQASKTPFDILITVGVELLGSDLIDEVNGCKPSQVIQFNYRKSPVPFKASLMPDCNYSEITPVSQTEGEVLAIEDVSETSVSVLVAEYLKIHQPAQRWNTPEVKRLISVVTHYTNFKSFNKYFDFDQERSSVDMSTEHSLPAQDLAFLYYQLPALRKAEADASILTLNREEHFVYTPDSSNITAQTIPVRRIIHRNMSQVRYQYKTKQLTVPTVNVGEEQAFEVMRQLSYSFNLVITYEDVRNHRVWRIYTAKNDRPALDFLKALLEPTEEWVSGKIHYFITSLPQYEERIVAF